MQATLTETHTITSPEKRIWIVGFQDAAHYINLTFFNKAEARAFKQVWDNLSRKPLISVRTAL